MNASIREPEDYIKKSKERLITAANKSNDKYKQNNNNWETEMGRKTIKNYF